MMCWVPSASFPAGCVPSASHGASPVKHCTTHFLKSDLAQKTGYIVGLRTYLWRYTPFFCSTSA